MTEPVDNHHACQACHPPLTLPQLGHHFTVAGRQISARITSRSIMVRAFLCFCTALAQSAEPTESAAEIAARASQAMEAKDYVRAEALTRTAVRMDPEFAEGWRGRRRLKQHSRKLWERIADVLRRIPPTRISFCSRFLCWFCWVESRMP